MELDTYLKAGNRYILVVGDNFTKWMEAYGFMASTASVWHVLGSGAGG